MAENTPLTSYESNIPDDFHYSETTEISLEQSSDTVPSFLFDVEVDDETIGRALSSPLFIQEREEPADRRQAYHTFEESLLPAQSFSVCHGAKPSGDSENERIRIDFRPEIHNHEFQADSERKSIQELSGIIDSTKRN